MVMWISFRYLFVVRGFDEHLSKTKLVLFW